MQDTTGNECCAEVPTHPSHNKSLNADPFVRSKSAYHVESKEVERQVRLCPVLSASAFKSARVWQGSLGFSILRRLLPHAIFVALIPKDIPGSFCEF